MWCPVLPGDARRARATPCRLPHKPCPNIVAYQEQHSQPEFDKIEHLCYYINAWTLTRWSLSEDKHRDRDRAPPDVLASVYERCMLRAALGRRCGTHRAFPVTAPLHGGPRLRVGCQSHNPTAMHRLSPDSPLAEHPPSIPASRHPSPSLPSQLRATTIARTPDTCTGGLDADPTRTRRGAIPRRRV
jgi:hypothetical protein